ncbi:hypothetical protein P153DRAFT_119925 [Dothidotthia symphoricarpi CBS 119687]|uniref:RanBD1 domain-containing protein n=1 Tax=Dothidotthia symphoricarpi CBS 119687 TaxID=1392245 RepID=A0A6A6A2V0_9PLEO|nr:uncharacterized protein P153DRAFT_119925 [Dothidotthia symphoricarpi CBS 119687]KAF2125068.1 hypothetical protein P153DRAFT_119925 [Dothidotthia symphoricarpi CBS 119687]
MASKPPTSKPADTPTTSDDKFKASAFGSFSTSTASPFGGLASLAPASPFSAASGSKLSSFAGSAAPAPATGGGFGALGGSTKSAFGGSSFGSSLGGGFSSLGSGKPSWGTTTGSLSITGLDTKAERAFGAPGDKTADNEDSDDDNEDDDEAEKDITDEERRSSSHLLSQRKPSPATTHISTNTPTATETGEEGENTVWAGRAKLYTMDGKGTERSWKERGAGTFKFNITIDEPKKARFVLRADGTHRLLLNAAVTPQMVFGGDSHGAKPKDVRLLFNSPTADGELEMHLLKVCCEGGSYRDGNTNPMPDEGGKRSQALGGRYSCSGHGVVGPSSSSIRLCSRCFPALWPVDAGTPRPPTSVNGASWVVMGWGFLISHTPRAALLASASWYAAFGRSRWVSDWE